MVSSSYPRVEQHVGLLAVRAVACAHVAVRYVIPAFVAGRVARREGDVVPAAAAAQVAGGWCPRQSISGSDAVAVGAGPRRPRVAHGSAGVGAGGRRARAPVRPGRRPRPPPLFVHGLPGRPRPDGGAAAVLRTIPSKVLTLDDLGAPEIFKEIINQPTGIVLVTGATGSGKSTTLAAMVDHINTHKREHILTIEDPIEFVHDNKLSLVNQREVHRDTHSFNNALRSALREDPDVILVGELRDLETIRLAISAAETGHLVFGTLHTNSAPKTIDRIIDVFPAEEKAMVRSMLSESLRAVISQTLLKKVGGGRVAAHEIMVGIPAIRNLIREDKVPQMYSVIQTGQAHGMQTMDQCLQRLVAMGVITKQDAAAKSVDKQSMNSF